MHKESSQPMVVSKGKFVPMPAMKAYGETEVKVHSCLTSTLYGDEWSTPHKFDLKEIAWLSSSSGQEPLVGSITKGPCYNGIRLLFNTFCS